MTIAAFAPSSSDFIMSSWNLLNRPTGRLSTQKKPRSSRARRKVPLPEPLRPVTMMKEDVCMFGRETGTGKGGPHFPPVSSRARLDPADIAVLPLVDYIQ